MATEMHTSNLVFCGAAVANLAAWHGLAGTWALVGMGLGAVVVIFGWVRSWHWRAAGVLSSSVIWTVLGVCVMVARQLSLSKN
jgi:hypothetical protein